MASYRDLLDAIARVRASTGSPDAWQQGLSGEDIAVACTPLGSPAAIDGVLAKVRAAHPGVFAPTPAAPPTAPVPPPPPAATADPAPSPRTGEGAAAEAIRHAETALARQHSAAAAVDLQVLTAVLGAHATAADGLARLSELQREIETEVATRTDLDTPAGARGFQRFLIGKLREIRDVVENASLDATSKASLAAALASLYAAASPAANDAPPAGPAGGPATETDRATAIADDAGRLVCVDEGDPPLVDLPVDPGVDALPPAVAGAAQPVATPPMTAMPPLPTMPVTPPMSPASAMPSGWGAGTPGGAPLSGLSGLSGLTGSRVPEDSPVDLPVRDLPGDRAADDASVDGDPAESDGESPPADDPAATVFLPDGDTVVAPSPEVAAAITAAVAGAPIPDAFGWQGISVPAPGTPIAAPIDPARVIPGDIGLFADRHALALGHGKALMDRQIQPISSVTGPGFIGWQHPPEPASVTATPVTPAPDRQAATAPS